MSAWSKKNKTKIFFYNKTKYALVAAEGNGKSAAQVYVCVEKRQNKKFFLTTKQNSLSLLRRVTARAPRRCMSARDKKNKRKQKKQPKNFFLNKKHIRSRCCGG
jgi:hypothetical protein